MKNPHDLTRTPLGSSGGSGISVAAAFAVIGVGTDTGGSIRDPSAGANGIVGLKPTHGLISRDGIVPLALTFDTAGPMARNVHDVAVALSVMAAIDPADAATKKSEGHIEADYTRYLKADALKGARIGLARDFTGAGSPTWTGRSRPQPPPCAAPARPSSMCGCRNGCSTRRVSSMTPFGYPEFAAQIADYLKTLGPGYPKNIEQLIARAAEFNAPPAGRRRARTRIGGR